MNIQFIYKEKTYPVDFLDFVNKTVGFRILNDNLEMEGVFVTIEEGQLILTIK